MNFKKIVAVIIAAMMLCTVGVFAADATVITNFEDLKVAVAAGGEITLGANIETTETLEIMEGVEVTLDLAGYTFSIVNTAEENAEDDLIVNNGILTINDSGEEGALIASSGENSALKNYGTAVINGGTFKRLSELWYVIYNYGEIIINDIKLEGIHGGLYSSNAITTVNNGNFNVSGIEATTGHLFYVGGSTVLTINNGNFKYGEAITSNGAGSALITPMSSKAYIRINGGNFSHPSNVSQLVIMGEVNWGYGAKHEVTGGTFSDNTFKRYIAGNYEYSDEEGFKRFDAKIGTEKFATIQAAIDAAAEGDTIVLLGDVEYENYVYKDGATTSINVPAGKKFTIDLNGHVISGTNDTESSFELMTIAAGAEVTIDDSSAEKTGAIIYKGTRETANGWMLRAYTIYNKGTLIVNGGTIRNATPITAELVADAIDNSASWGGDGILIVNDGTLISDSYYAVRTDVNTQNTSDNGTKVNTTEFNGGKIYGFYLMDRGNDSSSWTPNTINITFSENAEFYPRRAGNDENQTAIYFRVNAKSTANVFLSQNINVTGTVTALGLEAQIGDKLYKKLSDALEEAKEGETVKLFSDAVIENAIIEKDIILDLNGNTLTIDAVGVQNNDGPWAAVHSFADVEFKNGNVVVNCDELIYNGIFYIAKDDSLKLTNVKLTTEGTAGTDLFVVCAPATLTIDESEIIANGVNKLINGGDKGAVVITDSKISVSDSERGFLNVNLTATDSEISLKNLNDNALRNVSGVIDNTDITIDGAEFGIKNDDGIKLEIKNDSNVEIKNTTAGDVLTNNTADIVVTDSLLDTENIINVENSVNVGGNEITLPDLDDLYELADGKGEIKVEAKNISTVDGIVVNDGEKAEYFDISVTVDGKEVAVNEEVKVRIKLGAVADGTVAVYHNNVKIGDFTPDSNNMIEFTTNSFSPFTLVYKAGEVAVGSETDEITAKIVPTADKSVFDIVLDGNGKKINKFRSAEIAIKAELGKGMNFKVAGSGNVQIILPETSGKGNIYEFNLNGTGENYITSDYITLGQIKVSGHGKGTLEILANDTDVVNFVVATVVDTESVQEIFTVGSSDAELVLDTADVEVDIPVLTNSLVVNVEFPNEVEESDYAYQQMQIRIYGGDITDADAEKYIYKLGADENEMDADGSYSITSTLRQGLIYNVEIKGAGYRTYDHQVIMTGNKVLTFWGNLKGGSADPEKAIDADFPDKTEEWTFLEGDVVMDYTVDIYDLSAVVSYFNRSIDKTVADDAHYAVYDLNRDGKIDAVDIGRVLNSWGK